MFSYFQELHSLDSKIFDKLAAWMPTPVSPQVDFKEEEELDARILSYQEFQIILHPLAISVKGYSRSGLH